MPSNPTAQELIAQVRSALYSTEAEDTDNAEQALDALAALLQEREDRIVKRFKLLDVPTDQGDL